MDYYQTLLRGFAWGYVMFPVMWCALWCVVRLSAEAQGGWGDVQERQKAQVEAVASDPDRVARLRTNVAAKTGLAVLVVGSLFGLVQFLSPHSTSTLHDGWWWGLISGMVTFRAGQLMLLWRAVQRHLAQQRQFQ